MLADIINEYGEKQSPYMRNLVNHLPMGQLAFYKLTKELEGLKEYSKEYNEKFKINPVKTEYPKKSSLEECLGKRELYESCLDIIKERSKKEGLDSLMSEVLNKYDLGMSSGLFHTLIRLAYGVEGYELDKGYKEEIERGLAYYVTGYREAKPFARKIKGKDIINEMDKLSKNLHISELVSDKDTMGQGMKALYGDELYVNELGFIIEGSPDDKIEALLELLIPTYYNSRNIVVLHCITGLHALIVLKEYYEDFSNGIDILTTSIITHILASNIKDYKYRIENTTELSWDCLKIKGSRSKDVHTVKLTYSTYQLSKLYNIRELKDIALQRIRHT